MVLVLRGEPELEVSPKGRYHRGHRRRIGFILGFRKAKRDLVVKLRTWRCEIISRIGEASLATTQVIPLALNTAASLAALLGAAGAVTR